MCFLKHTQSIRLESVLKNVNQFKQMGLDSNKGREPVSLISGGGESQSRGAEQLKALFLLVVRREQ